MSGLTARQSECLAFIQNTMAVSKVGPSFDEIKAALGLSSKSGVHRLVHGLAERGHIRLWPDRKRSIELAHRGVAIPFDDMAAAVAEEFFGGDEAQYALVRRVLIKAWSAGARQ